MTDITDHDRRQLREDAKAVINKTAMRSSAAVSIAQYVLSTVEAPAPTIAERLRYRADLLDNGDPDGDTPQALRDLATDAAQMERDLAEARAEVERERDLGVALAHERDDARAEVERLTAERDTEGPDDNDWLAGMKEAARYAINATRPNPADVPPAEAWLVEVNGDKRTAVKDSDADIPWNTVNTNGVFHAEYNENVTLITRLAPVTRLAPAPRIITNHDDLDRAKRDTIIRDARGVVCSRDSMGHAWSTFTNLADQRPHIALPATVLWEPEA